MLKKTKAERQKDRKNNAGHGISLSISPQLEQLQKPI